MSAAAQVIKQTLHAVSVVDCVVVVVDDDDLIIIESVCARVSSYNRVFRHTNVAKNYSFFKHGARLEIVDDDGLAIKLRYNSYRTITGASARNGVHLNCSCTFRILGRWSIGRSAFQIVLSRLCHTCEIACMCIQVTNTSAQPPRTHNLFPNNSRGVVLAYLFGKFGSTLFSGACSRAFQRANCSHSLVRGTCDTQN